MVESISLFENICNSQWFINTSIILFLNKIDVFTEKIKRASIVTVFPEYRGNNSYEEQIAYVRKKFLSVYVPPTNSTRLVDKTIYVHETCATDTGQVQCVIDSVIDTILSTTMVSAGFV